MAATMLYVAENKRKTLAGLLAGLLVLAIGFAFGQLAQPARPPDVTPQLAAARHQLARQHAARMIASGTLASAQHAITQLRATVTHQRATIARQRTTIERQHKRIRTLRHRLHGRIVDQQRRRR